MKVKSESEVSQSCPTLSDPMDCSLLGSSIHGIFQARVPEWVTVAFSNLGMSKKDEISLVPEFYACSSWVRILFSFWTHPVSGQSLAWGIFQD